MIIIILCADLIVWAVHEASSGLCVCVSGDINSFQFVALHDASDNVVAVPLVVE